MTKYLFNGREFETTREAENYICEEYAPEHYDEVLDEMYPEVNTVGCTFSPSYALKQLDRIAYRCGMLDYANSLYGDIEEIEEEEEEGED